jgi:hypothetical protein
MGQMLWDAYGHVLHRHCGRCQLLIPKFTVRTSAANVFA